MPRTRSTAALASPAGAAETAICTIANINVPIGNVIDLEGWVNFTLGTTSTSVTLMIRRGSGLGGISILAAVSGSLVAASGYSIPINAQDVFATDQGNLAYTLTLTATGATAQTTVNAVYLGALFGF